MGPLLRVVGAPEDRYTATLATTGVVVFVVMPRYTRLLQRWLFR